MSHSTQEIEAKLKAVYDKIIPYIPAKCRVGAALTSAEEFIDAHHAIWSDEKDLARIKIAEDKGAETTFQLWMGFYERSPQEKKTGIVCFEVVSVTDRGKFGKQYERLALDDANGLLARPDDKLEMFFLGWPTVGTLGDLMARHPSSRDK